MEDKFYTPEGRIADANVAHDVGKLEKIGRDAALKKEEELAKGLTKEQQEIRELMDQLPVKYGNAFLTDENGSKVRLSKDGEPYLITRPVEGVPVVVIDEDRCVTVGLRRWDVNAEGGPANEKDVKGKDLSVLLRAEDGDIVCDRSLYAARVIEKDIRRDAKQLKDFFTETQSYYQMKDSAEVNIKPLIDLL